MRRSLFFPGTHGLRPAALFAPCIVLAWGCTTVDVGPERHQDSPSRGNPPIWERVYAATQISPGDVWRIYLKGTDPDGDLRFVYVWAATSYRPTTPFRFSVDIDQRRVVSGYLDLYTSQLGGGIAPSSLRVQLAMEDALGLKSEPMTLAAELYLGARYEGPPPGLFEDRSLGRIPIETIPRGAGPGL